MHPWMQRTPVDPDTENVEVVSTTQTWGKMYSIQLTGTKIKEENNWQSSEMFCSLGASMTPTVQNYFSISTKMSDVYVLCL